MLIQKNMFDLSTEQRKEIWDYLLPKLETFYNTPKKREVCRPFNSYEIRHFVSSFKPGDTIHSIQQCLDGLDKFMVHTSHPSYYGLFNPRSGFASIIADLITATYNPQLAVWSHAPFAVEVENYLVREFAVKFGYNEIDCDGVFCSGGAESNFTALLSALNKKCPDYISRGLIALSKQPLVYYSSQTHHSNIKALAASGLGMDAFRIIPLKSAQEFDLEKLEEMITKDKQRGFLPLMIVVTMGTTGAGNIEPILGIHEIAKKFDIWLHADCAYGGGVILSQQYKHLIKGTELADSITFDAHKWMSVSMAASLFITKHKEILSRTFRITADYMPKEQSPHDTIDPFTHSGQWSRRFIGLKVYLSVLFYGWEGFDKVITSQIEMGKTLRKKLIENKWLIYNQSELPVVCFGLKDFANNDSIPQNICNDIIKSGIAWLSTFKINDITTLRACITNYLTGENDIDDLIKQLSANKSIYFKSEPKSF